MHDEGGISARPLTTDSDEGHHLYRVWYPGGAAVEPYAVLCVIARIWNIPGDGADGSQRPRCPDRGHFRDTERRQK
jgi:hypothetical protein